MKELELAVPVLISAAFNTVDDSLDDCTGFQAGEAFNLIDNSITQLGWGLSILYSKVTGDGMGVADAVGTVIQGVKSLDTLLHDFGLAKIHDNKTKRPNADQLAKLWIKTIKKTPAKPQ